MQNRQCALLTVLFLCSIAMLWTIKPNFNSQEDRHSHAQKAYVGDIDLQAQNHTAWIDKYYGNSGTLEKATTAIDEQYFGESTDGIQVALLAKQTTYTLGEDIKLTVAIENNSNKDRRLSFVHLTDAAGNMSLKPSLMTFIKKDNEEFNLKKSYYSPGC